MRHASALAAQEEETGKRILAGDIENLPLPELIQFFHLQGYDGTLFLLDLTGNPVGALYYRNRQIVHAIYQGIQGPEAVYSALRQQGGQFEFFAGTPEMEAPSVRESIQNLILEGLRRLDANDSEFILGLLPGDDQPVFLSPDPPSDDIRLTAKEWRILSLVNGKRSIQQIIEHSRRAEDEVRPVLAGLLAADLILTEKDSSYLDAIVLGAGESLGGVRFAAPTLVGTLVMKKIDGQKTLRNLLCDLDLAEEKVVEDLKTLVKLGRIRLVSGHLEFERWVSSG